jgi:hypothetical protein
LPASLWRVHQPSGSIIPLLATDAEPQPATLEGDVWIVEVPTRNGVTWSDGIPVTIDDVIFTAEQNTWPATVEGSDEGVWLVFTEPPGWAGFMADIGLQSLLPSHYWAPLIAQGFGPGTSREHDLAAPSAAGYRYVTHTDTSITYEAVLDWWDRGSTYETFKGGIRWINPGLGIDEQYGELGRDPIAEQVNGPHLGAIEYSSVPDSSSLVFHLQKNEADLSVTDVYTSFWPTDPNPVVPTNNPTSSLTFFAFDVGATESDIRLAVACMVDVEFMRSQVLQGVVMPFELDGVPRNEPCRDQKGSAMGSHDDERLAEAVSALADAGWSWDGIPADPFPADSLPSLNDPLGKPVTASRIASVRPSTDPLRATTSLWIETWSHALGIPVHTVDPDGEPLSSPRDKNLNDLPPFGSILQTEPSFFPGLEMARVIADAGTPWSDLAAEYADRLAAAPDHTSYVRERAAFIGSLVEENIIIPLYRSSRQDLYNDWVVLPYTEAVDGFEYIEQVLEAVRIKR